MATLRWGILAWFALLPGQAASSPVLSTATTTTSSELPSASLEAAVVTWDFVFGGNNPGLPSECKAVVNDFLGALSEYDKLGTQLAATLLALVPALLVSAPLPTANVATLLYLLTDAAFLTAALTFGLHVESFPSRANAFSAQEFRIPAGDTSKLAMGASAPTPSIEGTHGQILSRSACFILESIMNKRPSRLRVIMIGLGFTILQIGLAYLLIVVVNTQIDNIYPVWMCSDWAFSVTAWLFFISVVVAGVGSLWLRPFFSPASEVFYLHRPPEPSNPQQGNPLAVQQIKSMPEWPRSQAAAVRRFFRAASTTAHAFQG